MDVRTRASYRIEALGGLGVVGGTTPLTGAATQRKTLLLLAALAVAGAKGMSRDRLIGLFWADSDQERARRALKQALHALRRDLRDPELVVGSPTLRLNPERITSDLQEFEEALAQGALEQAVALYRGPLLDGLYLDGADEFERWLERERARLADAHAAALERLAAAATEAGDHARAVEWWRRRAATAPLSSRVATELMKALVTSGDPEAALQHARVHETLVWQELETPADPAVAALAAGIRDDLRARRASPPPPEAPPSPARAGEPAAADDDDDGPERDGVPPVADPPADPPAAAVGRRPEERAPGAAPAIAARRRRSALAAGLIVALAALGALAASTRDGRRQEAVARAPRSVAVLPFVDMSSDPANAYFSDGLSEELITALSRVDGLRVAARTSSFALRDARLNVRTIGDTLGVATVVEGSVRRDGDRLRVTAQLIDAESGYQLWSGEFDRELRDVFAVQDEIAGAIVAAMRVSLAEGDDARGAAPTANREAYDLYLRGTYLRDRVTREAIATAITYFDRAIALDSGYALAYAGKATAIGPLLYFRLDPREPGLTEMRAAARRALQLDDRLGEAHVALGIIHFFYEWEWDAAGREFRRATELNPGDAHAFHMLANYLRAVGRFDAAIAARRRALELDPLNARIAISLGRDYTAAGQLDRAAEQYRRGFDLDSMNPLLLGLGPNLPVGLGEVYERQGRHAEAVEEYLRVATRRGARAGEIAEMRAAWARGGMPGFWRRWLAFEERTSGSGPRAIVVARLHERMGDTARAVAWLERAAGQRDPGLVYLGVDPEWAEERAHPRVAALLERMGLR